MVQEEESRCDSVTVLEGSDVVGEYVRTELECSSRLRREGRVSMR